MGFNEDLAQPLLSGDLGGTKCHLALSAINGQGGAERRYDSHAYESFEALVGAFLAECRASSPMQAAPRFAAFAVAGPVHEDRSRTTNLPWLIDARALERTLGIRRVRLLNDFTAQALAIEALSDDDRVQLHEGQPEPRGHVAVLGAGTGLGEAIRVTTDSGFLILPSEGGHADFAPTDERQVELWRFLHLRHGRVSYERLLSGAGLTAIHAFLCASGRGEMPSAVAEAMHAQDPAAVVSRFALTAADPTCEAALDLFCEIYGQEAGNLALKVLPAGGVYLCGGIAPKILPRLRAGAFVRGYLAKGRMASLVARFPVFVVKHPASGLLGASVAARALQREGVHP